MKKIIYLFFLVLSLTASLIAAITSTQGLEPFEKALLSADRETLVIFDVDETLIIPQDMILRPCNQDFLQHCFNTLIYNPAISEKYSGDYLISKTLSKIKYVLVDAKMPALIRGLQQKGIKVIALTAMQTGPFGVIPCMEDWRIQQLKELMIDFQFAFPSHFYLKFPTLRGAPVFKQGILCSSQTSKGEALLAFLDAIKWLPKKILFIDDKLNFLLSVESAAEKRQIDFQGFHYLAAKSYPGKLNEELAKFQFRYLAEQGEWLSDEEAQKALLINN